MVIEIAFEIQIKQLNKFMWNYNNLKSNLNNIDINILFQNESYKCKKKKTNDFYFNFLFNIKIYIVNNKFQI